MQSSISIKLENYFDAITFEIIKKSKKNLINLIILNDFIYI